MVLENHQESGVLGVKDSTVEKENVVGFNTGVPYVISKAPTTVFVGELYEYVPRLADMDTDTSQLSLELVESPDWLHVSDGVVSGVVPSVVDTYSFVLKVSDGYNSSQEKSYILVQERDE